jgi:replication factor A1
VDKYRVDGSRILVAEVEVGDDSGSISLRARDDQIDLLREVSNKQGAIVLRNCTVELYQGKHLRLGVSKWGKMRVYPVSDIIFPLIQLRLLLFWILAQMLIIFTFHQS